MQSSQADMLERQEAYKPLLKVVVFNPCKAAFIGCKRLVNLQAFVISYIDFDNGFILK